MSKTTKNIIDAYFGNVDTPKNDESLKMWWSKEEKIEECRQAYNQGYTQALKSLDKINKR